MSNFFQTTIDLNDTVSATNVHRTLRGRTGIKRVCAADFNGGVDRRPDFARPAMATFSFAGVGACVDRAEQQSVSSTAIRFVSHLTWTRRGAWLGHALRVSVFRIYALHSRQRCYLDWSGQSLGDGFYRSQAGLATRREQPPGWARSMEPSLADDYYRSNAVCDWDLDLSKTNPR